MSTDTSNIVWKTLLQNVARLNVLSWILRTSPQNQHLEHQISTVLKLPKLMEKSLLRKECYYMVIRSGIYTAKCYQETPDISLPAMRHILKKPWTKCSRLGFTTSVIQAAEYVVRYMFLKRSPETPQEKLQHATNMQQPCHTES